MLQGWHWLRGHRYEGIAALNGALVMMLEIVGARMIAPYFGSSIYVWTAVVGVILGGLSAGYYYGGRLADDAPDERYLALILLMGAVVLLVVLLTRDFALTAIAASHLDLRIAATAAALILFAPVNFLMGMVAPYLAKLRVTSLDHTGTSVGGLYAAGTVGSIVGTFASGYVLIALLGNRQLGIGVVLGLLVCSWMASPRSFVPGRLAAGLATVVALVVPLPSRSAIAGAKLVFDGDTAYTRVQVLELPRAGHTLRLMTTDNSSAESGMYVDAPQLPALGYVKCFLQAAGVVRPRRVLLIGGGALVFPRLLLDRFPDASIDVVEIDPKFDEVAAKYFGYRPDRRLRILHEDGRTFLNSAPGKYDMVYMDAFNATTPPFQLTTREAAASIARLLEPGGVVVTNLISAWDGARAQFGRAEFATYQGVFPAARMGPMSPGPRGAAQNLLLVAGGKSKVKAVGSALGLKGDVPGKWNGPILTDDFAPVEEWTAAAE